jgi:hypothetical protein
MIARAPAELLRDAARALGPLAQEVVFVGGTTVELLLTDPAAVPVRVTEDVDCLLPARRRSDYYAFAERLLTRGFSPALDGPICRFEGRGLLLDVMPLEGSILGFTNRWYEEALERARPRDLGDGVQASVVTAPYLVATKLDAFRGRGDGDFAASADLEDVVAVIDGRAELLDEIGSETSPELQHYLSAELTRLLATRGFREALPGHLPPDPGGQQRLAIVLERMRRIAKTKKGALG